MILKNYVADGKQEENNNRAQSQWEWEGGQEASLRIAAMATFLTLEFSLFRLKELHHQGIRIAVQQQRALAHERLRLPMNQHTLPTALHLFRVLNTIIGQRNGNEFHSTTPQQKNVLSVL